jgi:hypothetical protein
VLVPIVQLPGRVLIIAAHGGYRALGRKIMSRRDAQVHPAS